VNDLGGAEGGGGSSTGMGSGTCAILSVTFILSVAWRSGAASSLCLTCGIAGASETAGNILTVALRFAICSSRETDAGPGELPSAIGEALKFERKNAAISS